MRTDRLTRVFRPTTLDTRLQTLSGLRGEPFAVLRFDLFATVEKTLDRTRARRLLVVNVKDGLDRTDNDVQRDPAFLPDIDERPIERAEKEMLSAATDKRVFDLCEVIEVIQDQN